MTMLGPEARGEIYSAIREWTIQRTYDNFFGIITLDEDGAIKPSPFMNGGSSHKKSRIASAFEKDLRTHPEVIKLKEILNTWFTENSVDKPNPDDPKVIDILVRYLSGTLDTPQGSAGTHALTKAADILGHSNSTDPRINTALHWRYDRLPKPTGFLDPHHDFEYAMLIRWSKKLLQHLPQDLVGFVSFSYKAPADQQWLNSFLLFELIRVNAVRPISELIDSTNIARVISYFVEAAKTIPPEYPDNPERPRTAWPSSVDKAIAERIEEAESENDSETLKAILSFVLRYNVRGPLTNAAITALQQADKIKKILN